MKFFRNNGLSLVLLAFFLLFWALQSCAGYRVEQEARSRHGIAPQSYGSYLRHGHFWQATAENWESEFLQMAAYIILTSFLFQHGSAESKDPEKPDASDEPVERHLHDPGAPAILRKREPWRWLYRYSLSLTLLALFAGAFVIHALGGYAEHREEALRHGESPGGVTDFVSSAEFWFQSMQNWQSEFLAVLALVVLSIRLRHHGSPESKKVWDPHDKTGKD